jgi:hypothetical protein
VALVSKLERFWKSVAIIMSFVSLLITSAVLINYNDRSKAAAKSAASLSGKFLSISSISKNELVEMMTRESAVVGISVVSISLISNRRQTTFFESELAGLRLEWERYMATRDSIPPVFTDNAVMNSRITAIINGKFECRNTRDTQIQLQFNAGKYAPTVCSIAVPPGFDSSGDFVGYINFFINEEILSDSEKARLAKEAVLISTKIYHRDISQ